MADNLKGIPFGNDDEGVDFPTQAKQLVYQEAVGHGVRDSHPSFSIDEVYVVWFAYTLGSWKALCSTSLPDGRYYEVTSRPATIVGDKSGQVIQRKPPITFVDTYIKVKNSEYR